MAKLAEIEGRIAGALERLAHAIEARDTLLRDSMTRPAADEGTPGVHHAAPEARAEAAIEAEAARRREAEVQIARLNRQLDAQGQELQRMRQAAASLRNELHRLREARVAELDAPGLFDDSLRAELAALEAERRAEAVELDAVMSALALHLSEGETAGTDHA